MVQLTQLTDIVYAVEVPSMAFGLMVNNYGNESELMYMLSMSDIADDDNTEETLITKMLPPGSWQLICTTRAATAMHAPELFGHAMISDHYAKETVNSLLTSKGLYVSKNYVLLKKG